MTDASIFEVLGLAYLAIGAGMLYNPKFYKEMLDKMIGNEAVLFLTGVLAVVLGYFLVSYHNIWSGGWTVLITIFGWLALLKGLMIVAIPEISLKLYEVVKIAKYEMKIYGIIIAALGVIFVLIGFTA